MKKLFVALSLVLGFSAAQALDGTLKIQSYVNHPQTGQTITIDFGNYVFDVFRDRRELVREVYNICKNPPEKIKTFLANRKNLGDTFVTIRFNDPTSTHAYKHLLDCSYSGGKLYSLGDSSDISDKTINKIISENVNTMFNYRFAVFIDAARADAKEKGVSITLPNKTVSIKFGSQTINPETGAEGIATYPSLDYEFNVYDDRRELWKKTWEACTKLQGNILKEIENGSKNPNVSVYFQVQGKLVELETLKCHFTNKGKYGHHKAVGSMKDYTSGEISADKVSKEDIEKWADEVSTSIHRRVFIDEFMTLVDAANASSKNSQKSGTKAKK